MWNEILPTTHWITSQIPEVCGVCFIYYLSGVFSTVLQLLRKVIIIRCSGFLRKVISVRFSGFPPQVLLDCLDVLTGVSEDPSGVTLQVDPETAFPCTLTIIAGSNPPNPQSYYHTF